MSLRDELLKPIPGPNPGGVDLRYDPIYDKIKDARREDDDTPQGEWATERKVADWPTVIKLSKEALTNKTKDLQLAAWLTEALIRREGFAGLASGLDLLGGLVEEHWDHLFPEIDDGDSEMRAAPLEWVGIKLELPARMVALDRAGNNAFQHKEARLVPSEAAANDSTDASNSRQAAIAAGKTTPEVIDSAFAGTTKDWFKALLADVESSRALLTKLDEVSTEKFGSSAPSYSKLRDTLDEIQRLAAQQVKRKLEIEPDPVDVSATSDAGGSTATTAASAAATSTGPLTPEPTTREDAASRVVASARFLRRSEPFNPASYLLLRGFRWGELRATPGGPDPRLLEAPPTSVRTSIKGLLLDARWSELLEACESVMGTPHGRGWLDLQRYAIAACDGLGRDYGSVTLAIRGALRSLLTDIPQLMNMTLMDDAPTANAETRAWLRTDILAPVESKPASEGGTNGETPPSARTSTAVIMPDLFAIAATEARAGRTDRAISLLMREAAREKTTRGRFLVQAQLARVMVEAGHEGVALPILEQLIADIEEHKLEDWEAGELVAAPMSLLYRVLTKLERDEQKRESLYLRICRLDPIQAISFSQS